MSVTEFGKHWYISWNTGQTGIFVYRALPEELIKLGDIGGGIGECGETIKGEWCAYSWLACLFRDPGLDEGSCFRFVLNFVMVFKWCELFSSTIIENII